jgi:hypothetical protein
MSEMIEVEPFTAAINRLMNAPSIPQMVTLRRLGIPVDYDNFERYLTPDAVTSLRRLRNQRG